MFLIKRHIRHERGDTMIEVLIVIAVISLVLAGAYVTTSRSLESTRAAQERVIALKLAETQIERIKGLAASTTIPHPLFGPSAPTTFCVSPSSGQPVGVSGSVCAFSTSGTNNNTNEPIFNISIVRAGNYFVLTETWQDVGGRNGDRLNLRYRVYD